MEKELIIMTILGMAVVTYLPRMIPLLVLSGRKLPPFVTAWLRNVPAAVLAGMLLPLILIQDGKISIGINNLFLWAALPTFITAIISKSLFTPVIIGMLIIILARLLGV